MLAEDLILGMSPDGENLSPPSILFPSVSEKFTSLVVKKCNRKIIEKILMLVYVISPLLVLDSFTLFKLNDVAKNCTSGCKTFFF